MNSNQKYSIIFKDTNIKIINLPNGKPKDLLRKLWTKLILKKNDITPIAEFFEKEKNDDIFKSESHIFDLIINYIENKYVCENFKEEYFKGMTTTEFSLMYSNAYHKIQNLPYGKPKDLLRKLWKKLQLTKIYIAPIAKFFEKEKNDDIFKSESHIFELIINFISN